MSFFQELKRRNVFRVGIAYLLISWVLLQGADFAIDLIDAPNWVIQALFLLSAIGLLVAVIFAWVFEVTPEGIKRESDLDRSHSITPQTGRKLDRVIVIFLALAVVALLAERFLAPWEDAESIPPPESSGATPVVEEQVVSTPSGGPVTIAVLPFVNMSSDKEQEYFSDGITEEILNRLAGVRGLQVVARTSTFSFKGQNQDVRKIAQLLGVGNILEGSVRKAGDQVRITAQLIRASDGFHLWSEAYDRKLENIFAIQDDIANQISEALQISLGVTSAPSRQASKRVNPEVYDLYLRARALHRQRGPGLLEAISLFERALAIDPEFAPAWAGLSHSYNVVINYVSPADAQRLGDVGEKSMEAAQKALELDPNLPTALHALANNLFFRYEWAKAEEYYLRALQLDPDSADIMEDYASLLIYSWRMDTALQVAERMVELDPRVPVFLHALSLANHAMGNFEMRDRNVRAALDINPEFGPTQGQKFVHLLQYEQFDEARRYTRQMNAETSNPDELLRLVDWVSDPGQEPDTAVMVALQTAPAAALLVGRNDLWLNTLEQMGAQWSEWELGSTIDLLAPVVSPELMRKYRTDPRSKAWLKKMRLPEYWREVGWPEQCRPLGEDDFECD